MQYHIKSITTKNNLYLKYLGTIRTKNIVFYYNLQHKRTRISLDEISIIDQRLHNILSMK